MAEPSKLTIQYTHGDKDEYLVMTLYREKFTSNLIQNLSKHFTRSFQHIFSTIPQKHQEYQY
jgi:hypothetical protein